MVELNPDENKVSPGKPGPVELAGRWKGESGDTFDFIADSAGFHVNHFNSFGMKIEEGRATQDGTQVLLTLTSVMGASAAQMKLRGNMLEGELKTSVMGMTLPLVLFKPPQSSGPGKPV